MARTLHLRKWRRRGTVLLTAIVAGLAGAAPAGAAASCANADLEGTAANEARVTAALVCLINDQRAQRGLAAVKVNRKLARAAAKHSRDMVRRRYFAHQSRSGNTMVTRARREGYLRGARSWWLAENIAFGAGAGETSPRAILDSWLESPPHRANMLFPKAREAGLGMAAGSPDGGSGGATFTLMLGKRG